MHLFAITAGSAVLLLGIPELAIFVSVVILGKSGFIYLKQKLFALFKRAAPIEP